MARTRVCQLLQGYRGRPPADLDAVALTLIRVCAAGRSMLPEIVELDINPLLADEDGVVALDARMRVRPGDGLATDRLAIRPYPQRAGGEHSTRGWTHSAAAPDPPGGRAVSAGGLRQARAEEIRQRFFVPMKTLSHVTAARFTQIDYDREMALILTQPGIPGKTDLYGVVRLSADPDNERAEYAIIVRGDMTGMGLGIVLMRRIIDYARSRGLREIYGDVLQDNATMLKLCRAFGFSQATLPDDPTIVRVTLRL